MFKNLFSFKGRATRSEFWKIEIAIFFILFVGAMVAGFLAGFSSKDLQIQEDISTFFIPLSIIFFVFILPLMIINWAVIVRRLHDINLSGWFILVFILIGYIDKSGILNLLLLIVLGAIPSTQNPTKWDKKKKSHKKEVAEEFRDQSEEDH